MRKDTYNAWFSCKRKNTYGEKEALGQAKMYTPRLGQKLSYCCPYCNGWHVGGAKGKNAQKGWRKTIINSKAPKILGKTLFPHRAAEKPIGVGHNFWIVPEKDYREAIDILKAYLN